MPLDTGMKPVRKHNLLWEKKGRQESVDFLVVIKHEEVTWKKIVCMENHRFCKEINEEEEGVQVCGKAQALSSLHSGSSL